jgi:hypothetical protein
LSGTGKTTLSADPERVLIGDDEHGWDKQGIFNYEGGCYAKTINLSKKTEPDIYRAISTDALLENVKLVEDGSPDYFDFSKTENGSVSYVSTCNKTASGHSTTEPTRSYVMDSFFFFFYSPSSTFPTTTDLKWQVIPRTSFSCHVMHLVSCHLSHCFLPSKQCTIS